MKRTLLIAFAAVILFAGARWFLFFNASARADRTASLNGDVNGDGARDLSDVLYILNWLFLDGSEPVAIADSAALEDRVRSLEEQVAQLAAQGSSPETVMKNALADLKKLSTGSEGIWDFTLHVLKKAEGSAAGPATATLLLDGAPVGTVLGFNLAEEVSMPPRLDIITQVPIASFTPVGLEASLKLIYQDEGGQMVFHGEVGEACVAGSDAKSIYLRVAGFSKLNRLARGRKSRIFQGATVPDILKQILAAAGITEAEFEFVFEAPHPSREYCVQYRESDFDFASRLMEEEGIWTFFTYSADGAKLRFGDGSQGRIPPTGKILGYPGYLIEPPAGSVPYISALHRAVSPAIGQVTIGDFDFVKVSPVFGRAGVAGSVEDFDFGVNLFDPPSLNALALRRLERAQVTADVLRGASNSIDLRPGIVISIGGTDQRFNGKYYVVGATHRYVHAGSPQGGGYYGNSFECIPEASAHRPPCTRKPIAPGAQSAIVTGPPGQQTYTDALGRVKVKFFWDRSGSADEKSSAWIRVAQNNAAATPGFFLPEVGDEVIVAFEHGDINRPYVIGSLWNGKDRPPN